MTISVSLNYYLREYQGIFFSILKENADLWVMEYKKEHLLTISEKDSLGDSRKVVETRGYIVYVYNSMKALSLSL